MVEDLINSPPFYPAWLAERGESWDGPLVPHLARRGRRANGPDWRWMPSGGAWPILQLYLHCSPSTLNQMSTFDERWNERSNPCPTRIFQWLTWTCKLWHLATQSMEGHCGLGDNGAINWVQASLGPSILRSFPELAIQQVTKQRDIGFIAVLVILTSWADTGFPCGLVKGLPAAGYAPPYGIFPQQPARRITLPEVLCGWEEHNQKILNQLKPGKDDAFLLQQSLEDYQWVLHTSAAPLWIPLLHRMPSSQTDPKVCHDSELWKTASDRQRGYWRANGTLIRQQLRLCNPLQPAQQYQPCDAPDPGILPYMFLQESLGCVVVWSHDELQEPAYQVACLSQWLLSTAFPGWWKRCPGAESWCPSTSTMLRSQTSSPPKDQDNGQWINYALWSAPHPPLTRSSPCRTQKHS